MSRLMELLIMKKIHFGCPRQAVFLSLSVAVVVAASAMQAFGGQTGPWTKEKAWEWYNAQPWIRGCNYMPASAANRMDMWQEYGSKERFEEMDRELQLAIKELETLPPTVINAYAKFAGDNSAMERAAKARFKAGELKKLLNEIDK